MYEPLFKINNFCGNLKKFSSFLPSAFLSSILPFSLFIPRPPAPGDYQTIVQTLTFSFFNTSHKVIMRIVDDHFVEREEGFFALLITAVNGLILSQPSARIVIIDDDGVFVCAYMHFISTIIIYFFIFHF